MPESAEPSQEATQKPEPNGKPQRLSRLARMNLGDWSSAVAAALGVLAALGGLIANSHFFSRKIDENDSDRLRVVIQQARAQAEKSEMDSARIRNTIDALARENAELSKKHGTSPYAVLSPTDRQTLQDAKSIAEQLRARLGSLEAALMATPEKAVALPMMKQQVDLLQDRTRSDIDSIRGEMGRLFVLVQWCMGILITIGLAVLGIAINNMRKTKLEPEPATTTLRAGA